MGCLASIGADLGVCKTSEILEIYDNLFADIRQRVSRVLEFGISRGASLEMWAQYFPNAEISGIDIYPLEIQKHPRINIQRQRQERYVPDRQFDIIIDDCAHIRAAAECSLTACWPSLVPNGHYCIEDWGTGYWDNWPDGKTWAKGHNSGMVGLIKDMVDIVGIGDIVRGGALGPLDVKCKSIQIWHGLAVIRK